ncbi:MAG: hypothetical protein EOP55_06460 [Sphingobacteriales bacterium]|nr:MAG: hypothetical protein EOP55_06460 [Sphingobacteriales bacterium]
MKTHFVIFAGLATLLFSVRVDAKHFVNAATGISIQDTISLGKVLESAYSINTRQMEMAGLASKSGNSATKMLAKKSTDYFAKSNADIRMLAKHKNIALSMTKPLGGMRPDGRVDSSPENMRDTSRNQSGTGEAGNTGLTKKAPNVDQSISMLEKLKGASFNKSYTDNLNKDLNDLQMLYESAVKSSDSSLKSFAQKQLTQINSLIK